MPYLVVITLVPLIGVLLYAFVLFDRLLRVQYEEHRSAWEADGRPAGFFWRAQECDFLKRYLSRARLAFAWLFRTPTWIERSSASAAMLSRHRFIVLIWNIGILIWFVSFAYSVR